MKKAIRGQAKFGHVKRQTMQLQTADLADGGFFKKIYVILSMIFIIIFLSNFSLLELNRVFFTS